jgi:metal-responsive CopG/Arc/MetJ family transcriptional regulator
MAKAKFGIAVDEEIVQEVDELVAECDDLGASRSEIVEAILTAFIQSDSDHAKQVREVIIRKRKGTL